jgi:hypothetical protein
MSDLFWQKQPGHISSSKKRKGSETLQLHKNKLSPSKSSNIHEEISSLSAYNDLSLTEPLAVVLINSLFHLLFLPDFTIPDPQKDFSETDLYSSEFQSALLWASGAGKVEKSATQSSQYDINRVEILRLMIASLCDPLYQTPEGFDSCASYWLEVATSADTPYADLVFYSLLNTVLGTLDFVITYENYFGNNM